ncbi:nucleotidyltransferase [Alicyclobacillus mengziensis]|uniref:nucleotidyltransferase n=1 Tax=Alicyclobacillus mengziensis TaxID=2931921 RepID=UPI00201291F7|nr:nucleotidyltransferase [Alicyclobacillus mengziensis]
MVLSNDEQTNLRGKRDLNIDRLKNGLTEYNTENSTNYVIVDTVTQGSMAMSTITQNDNSEYDIDIAIIFDTDNIPNSTQRVKQIVADSLKKKMRSFRTDPEVKTNAVTVEYADGYHVDFAIYRRLLDENDNYVYEHCGASWSPRDPWAITRWFLEQNDEDDNLRKVVRLLKMFCKSRSGWLMPGGLIQSVLASENTLIDARLDITFYNTICAIRDRLNCSQEVINPVDSSISLLFNAKDKQKVKNLFTRLTTHIEKLGVLFEDTCTEQQAVEAWNEFFKHSYWGGLITESVQDSVNNDSKRAFAKSVNYDVDINVMVRMTTLTSLPLSDFKGKLPKGKTLVFTATPNFDHTRIQWKVINEGDEAEYDDDLKHDQTGHQVTETTKYRGNHQMVCMVYGKETPWMPETLLYSKAIKVRIR